MVGLALFLAFWYFYVRRVLAGVLRLYRQEYSTNPLRVLTVLALLSGTIGTLVHCVFTFDLHLIYSMVTFYCWMAFALILVGVRYDELPLPRIPGLKYILLFSAVALSLYFAFGMNDYYYATTFHMVMVYGLAVFFGLISVSFFLTNVGVQPSLSLRINSFFVIFGLSTAVFLHLEDIYQRDKYWRLAFAQFSAKNWKESFNLYQKALQHDSTLGELLFDFGRAMMDSNDNPRIPKSDIDRFSIKTITRNLNLHTMYQRDKEGPNDELTDENLTNNFIAVSAFLEARYNFTDPANFHNIALCFYKEHQQYKNRAVETQQRAQQLRDQSLMREAERLLKLSEILGEKSKDYYRAAIDLNPIYAQSLSNLGYLSALEAQRELAETSAMTNGGNAAEIRKNKALSEMETARSMLQRAFRLPDGKTPTTILGLATIHQSLGELEDALQMYIELDRVSPGNPDAKIRIAEIYQHQFLQLNQAGNEVSAEQIQRRREYLEKAEQYFFEAAELQSGDMSKRLRHRALRLRIHRLSELFRENAEDYKNYMELALTWVKLGIIDLPDPEREENLSKGIGALRNLIQRNPNDVEARLFLARAYEEMGDIESVRESYERVLRLMSPSHSEYRNVLRRLQVLQLNNSDGK
jgi:tetratricopeptide (TPR) repeat protein